MSRSCIVRMGKRSKELLIGDGQPLRLVAPFGMSSAEDLKCDFVEHVDALVSAGADAVQELSVFGPYSAMREELVEAAPVPYGTVLAYELYSQFSRQQPRTISELHRITLRTLAKQIEDGVSYSTIHASLSHSLIEVTSSQRNQRAIPIPSRAGGLLVRIMRAMRAENPLRSLFEDISRMCSTSGVVISLGASFRPAAIADAMDQTHRAELAEQATLVSMIQEQGGQSLLEGLSHGLPEDVAAYCREAGRLCPGVPITALGPLPVDVAAGMDHIAAAIGIVFGRIAGLSLVNVVSAKEHLSMPTKTDMISALQAARLGAYVAEAIRQTKRSERDRLMSDARNALEWEKMRHYALFPQLVDAYRSAAADGRPCSICAHACPLLGPNPDIEDDLLAKPALDETPVDNAQTAQAIGSAI